MTEEMPGKITDSNTITGNALSTAIIIHVIQTQTQGSFSITGLLRSKFHQKEIFTSPFHGMSLVAVCDFSHADCFRA